MKKILVNLVKKCTSLIMLMLLIVSMVVEFQTLVNAAAAGTMLSNAVNARFGETYLKEWTKSTDHLNHYVKFTVSKKGVVTINSTKTFDDEGEYGRMEFTVYDSTGEAIWGNECYKTVDNVKSDYTMKLGLNPGTYYLTIKPRFSVYSGVIETYYTLSFAANANCEIEPNNAGYQAALIELNKKYIGYYGADGSDYEEADYFKMPVTSGHTYRIYWYNWSKMSSTSTMVQFLDPSGEEHSLYYYFSQKFTNDGISYADFEIEKSGTGYLSIDNWSGEQVEYGFLIKDLTCLTTGHKYSSWKTTKAATCKAAGQQTRTCSACGDTETKSIAKTSHKFTAWKTTKAATCSAAGQQERNCTFCSKKETKTIAKKSHNFSVWETTREATCSATGQQVRTCSVCSHKETASVSKLAHKYGEWETTKEPTCTSKGTKIRICSECSSKDTQSISILGHKMTDPKIVKEPTCTEKGVQEGKCTVCGYVGKSDVAELGHTFGDEVVVIKPTTQSTGTGEKICTKCGHKETFVIEQLVDDGSINVWYIIIPVIAVLAIVLLMVWFKKKNVEQ